MRNANAVGQPRGGVGPSLAAQGFTGIVALKPSTEGIENVAFNDFTMGVDTTALVQAENIYEIERRVFAHRRQARAEIWRRDSRKPDQHASRRGVQRQLWLSTDRRRASILRTFCWACRRATRRGRRAISTIAISTWRRLCRTVGKRRTADGELRRALGSHSAVAREVQPVADAGEGRAVAGLSRRAAGAGISGRSGRAAIAGAGAEQFCSADWHCVVADSFAAPWLGQDCRASGIRRASAWATGCSTPRTKDCRRAS